ncbi:hypothetical protein L5515_015753 [Caenorhabditis briggsae]|uniref:Uncharacterized protein n=1 Tax=Caenorhabditis briggsae TaxID=6238 RepID=A0AAE9EEY1_CAEBR|nr:hypothetical protein L5515_015753 [Caenorhabditis briggsae]
MIQRLTNGKLTRKGNDYIVVDNEAAKTNSEIPLGVRRRFGDEQCDDGRRSGSLTDARRQQRLSNIRADTLVHQLYRAIEYVIQIARKLAKGIPRLAKNHKNCRVAASSLKDYVILPEPAQFEGELEFLVGRVGGDVESMYRVVEKASCICLQKVRVFHLIDTSFSL